MFNHLLQKLTARPKKNSSSIRTEKVVTVIGSGYDILGIELRSLCSELIPLFLIKQSDTNHRPPALGLLCCGPLGIYRKIDLD